MFTLPRAAGIWRHSQDTLLALQVSLQNPCTLSANNIGLWGRVSGCSAQVPKVYLAAQHKGQVKKVGKYDHAWAQSSHVIRKCNQKLVQVDSKFNLKEAEATKKLFITVGPARAYSKNLFIPGVLLKGNRNLSAFVFPYICLHPSIYKN